MEAGWWLVGVSGAAAALAAFPLRTRLHGRSVFLLLSVSGAGLAAGGMLLRPDPSVGEWVLGVGALAILAPLHARIVLGRFGPR